MAATQELEYRGNVHPKKFSLWLLLIGIMMLFAGLTSAYIVRMGDGNWLHFKLPTVFLYSTIIVLLSSVSMIYAYRSAKKGNKSGTQIGTLITLLLGIGFVISQYYGWIAMQGEGLHFVNPKFGDKVSASFLIAIAAIHLIHIFIGLIYLLVVLIKSSSKKHDNKNTLQIDMCNTYWHFVGLLWVYLYLFLYFAPEI